MGPREICLCLIIGYFSFYVSFPPLQCFDTFTVANPIISMGLRFCAGSAVALTLIKRFKICHMITE